MSETSSHPSNVFDLIRPTAIQHLDHAIELLAEDGPLSAKTIHDIRRTIKRIRALLQLMLAEDKPRRREWDALLQSVNRTLSGARDLEVCLHHVRELSRTSSSSQRKVLDQLASELTLRQHILQAADSPDVRPELSAQLETVKAGLLEWRPETTGFALIKPALRKMSKSARSIIKELRDHITGQGLHSLRKVVKRRLYWLETFEHIWPRGFGAERQMVDSLSDRLGRHHDLEVLLEQLHESEAAEEEAAHHSVRRITHKLKQRQQKLERSSLKLARQLFAERPKAMTKRWQKLVKIWQDSPTRSRTKDESQARDDDPFRIVQGESA